MLEEWHEALREVSTRRISAFLAREEKEGRQITPPGHQIFRCFNYCPPDKIKAVIVGQDPYPTHANGLAFSVDDGAGFPSSLINIFKELKDDLGYEEPISGDLEPWAKRGVLLLNSVLTNEEGKTRAHANQVWEEYTDQVIRVLNKNRNPIVFMLWGKDAIKKESCITNPRHLVLKSTHPAPLSASSEKSKLVPFFGSKPFSTCNQYLKKFDQKPIDWSLEA